MTLKFLENANMTYGQHLVLIILMFIGILGAAKPAIFNGGSPMAKYIAKEYQLEMVEEENIEAYFESVVFGEGKAEIAEVEIIDEAERKVLVERIFKVDQALAWMVLLIPFLLLHPKVLYHSPAYHVLLVLSLWLLLISIGSMLNGGKKFYELSIMAHATRWGLPLFIWALLFSEKHKKYSARFKRMSLYLLIICTSLTFGIHGLEAWRLNPPFQDLIYSFGAIFNVDISSEIIHRMLKVIGAMDMILALLIIFVRHPAVFLWMAFWGFITALSRPLTLGFDAWPEFAMRIANSALPFILFYIYKTQKQTQEQEKPASITEDINYEKA